jgi:FkbM family methyltransferase
MIVMKYLMILWLQFLKTIFPNGLFVKMKNVGTPKLRFWVDNKTDNGFIIGFYEPALTSLVRENLKKDMVFYDLGAHWGYFTLLASVAVGTGGKVYSFEPMQKNYARLKENINVNKLDIVESYKIAASDKNGVVRFSDSEDSFANSYMTKISISNHLLVETIKLDTFIYENNHMPPNFIKIDVEGAEFDVLKGAQKTINEFMPTISLSTHEIHNPGVDLQCISFLEQMNYTIELFYKYKNGLIKDYICYPKKNI